MASIVFDDKARLDLLNTDEEGTILLSGAVWRGTNYVTLSVYAFSGIRTKRRVLVARRTEYCPDMLPRGQRPGVLENMAALWALRRGVSDYKLQFKWYANSELLHKTQRGKEVTNGDRDKPAAGNACE